MLCTDNLKLPSQWELVKSEESVAFFKNAAGDVLSINHFGIEPDIGAEHARNRSVLGPERAS